MNATGAHALSFFYTLDGRALDRVIESARIRNRAERVATGKVSRDNQQYLFLALRVKAER